ACTSFCSRSRCCASGRSRLVLFCRDHGFGVRDQMPVAPVADRGDHGDEALALAGEAIFHLGRDDAVILAVNQAAFGQRLQLPAPYARRDLAAAVQPAQQPGPDLAVAARPILQVPYDPELVFAADQLLERRNRAGAASSRLHHAVTSRKKAARSYALKRKSL